MVGCVYIFMQVRFLTFSQLIHFTTLLCSGCFSIFCSIFFILLRACVRLYSNSISSSSSNMRQRWRWRRNICDIKRVNTHYMRTQHTIRYVYVLLYNMCVCGFLLIVRCCCFCFFFFFFFTLLLLQLLFFLHITSTCSSCAHSFVRLLVRPRFSVVQFNLCIYLLCIKTDPCTHNRAAAREL